MELLHNITWHSLAGPQAHYAAGAGGARRYAAGFSPIVAFADLDRPDFAALAACCEPGEHFYCGDWSGAAPSGWQIDVETTMHQMVWDGPPPAANRAPVFVRLEPRHVTQMLELTALTQPGPFGPRTIELGDYIGRFEGERLVAMAGERMQASRLREISGVCTHPDHQGRGLARELIDELVRRELQRDELPFLHVMRDNVGAIALYERMGFRRYRETSVRVLSRLRQAM